MTRQTEQAELTRLHFAPVSLVSRVPLFSHSSTQQTYPPRAAHVAATSNLERSAIPEPRTICVKARITSQDGSYHAERRLTMLSRYRAFRILVVLEKGSP